MRVCEDPPFTEFGDIRHAPERCPLCAYLAVNPTYWQRVIKQHMEYHQMIKTWCRSSLPLAYRLAGITCDYSKRHALHWELNRRGINAATIDEHLWQFHG
ncbi:hypothetical protein GCM10022226_61870 [Sphaerisporangium flaviroseum]|uniref:Uncharacterized protein n=1 Tax=Sphaerisporangium flaviroseum TaxID=509199 RepID=A0ABP7J2L6_9ACTN